MSGVAPGLGRPHLPEERGGDSGHLRLLGLVPLLLPAQGQTPQVQGKIKGLENWVICGLWDWFLYFSPLKDKLHMYKVK